MYLDSFLVIIFPDIFQTYHGFSSCIADIYSLRSASAGVILEAFLAGTYKDRNRQAQLARTKQNRSPGRRENVIPSFFVMTKVTREPTHCLLYTSPSPRD